MWNAKDGGEFFLEDYKVEYKAGIFIVFHSNTLHDGGYVKNETLNYWRVAVNIILDNEAYTVLNQLVDMTERNSAISWLSCEPDGEPHWR